MKARSLMILLALAVMLPGIAEAQQLVLEADATTAGLKKCDNLHHVETCDNYHVVSPVAAADMVAGATVKLNNQTFVIDWVGPGYYLDSGAIIQPVAEWTPNVLGQQWLEVWPNKGTVHTATSWNDLDGDGRLSLSDTVELAGVVERVRDVRLNLRVTPTIPLP